jgi:acetate---CoA ligase (ADP-forming) subunit beta
MTTPAEIIQTALAEGRKTLFEHEAKELVRSVGIVVPRHAVVDPSDPKAVAAAGEKLGFPVVLKAVSADIPHKTDAGAVMLNITTAAGLAASVTTMKNMIAQRTPGARIHRLLVEKMMPQGLELLIGGMRDEQFGPAVAFGLGGVWVEALKDAVFGILPLTHEELTDMISLTRADLFLKGFRGSPALDEEAVHLIIANLSRLLDDFPAIKELEMNPVRVYARSAAALDVRIVLQ